MTPGMPPGNPSALGGDGLKSPVSWSAKCQHSSLPISIALGDAKESANPVCFGIECQGLVGVLRYSRCQVCFIISLGERIPRRSSRRCKLCFTANHQDSVYSAAVASLLRTGTDVKCGQVAKGHRGGLQPACWVVTESPALGFPLVCRGERGGLYPKGDGWREAV